MNNQNSTIQPRYTFDEIKDALAEKILQTNDNFDDAQEIIALSCETEHRSCSCCCMGGMYAAANRVFEALGIINDKGQLKKNYQYLLHEFDEFELDELTSEDIINILAN